VRDLQSIVHPNKGRLFFLLICENCSATFYAELEKGLGRQNIKSPRGWAFLRIREIPKNFMGKGLSFVKQRGVPILNTSSYAS